MWVLSGERNLIRYFPNTMRATKQKSFVKCQCSTCKGRYIRSVYAKPFGCAMLLESVPYSSLRYDGCACRFHGSDTEISTSSQWEGIPTPAISAFKRIITETTKSGRCRSSGHRKGTRASTSVKSARNQFEAISLTSILSVSLH